MVTVVRGKLEDRVENAAGAALAERHFVTAIDVLVGIGWLTTPRSIGGVEARSTIWKGWSRPNSRRSRPPWAPSATGPKKEGLNPSEADYLRGRGTIDRCDSRGSGDATIEAAYSTHWVSPTLSEAKRARLAEKQGRAPDLVVISALKEWSCTECDGTGDLLFMEGDGPLCLECADLD